MTTDAGPWTDSIHHHPFACPVSAGRAGGRPSEAYDRGVQFVLLSVLVLVVVVAAAIVTRRSEQARAKIDRHGLDDLRRIYRRDNPRGHGLGPLIQDHRRVRVEPQPLESPTDEHHRGFPEGP